MFGAIVAPMEGAAFRCFVAQMIVHNEGHMMFGPGRGLHREQYAQQCDANVLGTQRVNGLYCRTCALERVSIGS